VPERSGAILVTLILVAAVANLNLSVANVALPSIGAAFNSSQVALNLIAVGYSLGLAASVLYLGAIGDRYGRKMLLVVGTLLAMLALQVATGLFADDEIASVGPLNRFVSNALAGRATHWHKDFGQWILLALVALHVSAIVYYRRRKKVDLVRSMLVGDKVLPAGTPAAADSAATRALALLLAVLCAGGVAWKAWAVMTMPIHRTIAMPASIGTRALIRYVRPPRAMTAKNNPFSTE